MPLVYRSKFALSPIQEQCESPMNRHNGRGDLMEKNNNQEGENGYLAKGQNGCHVNEQNGHQEEISDFEKENLTMKVNLNESPEIDELSLKLGLFNFDMLKKLPLRHQWTAWQWDMEKDANGNPINALQVIGNWEHALKQKDTFDTVEDFWRVYHLIKPADNDQVKLPVDYSIFKIGIKPMWEDPANMDGGRWLLVFPKDINKKPSSNLEIVWLEVLYSLVSEGFAEFSDEICGAVLNLRKDVDKISVWTRKAENTYAKLRIGEILKYRTGYKGQLKYENHNTTKSLADIRSNDQRQQNHNQQQKPKRCISY